MKIVFCWSNISGYMAACWREMASRPGVDLHVLAYGDSRETAFAETLMQGISWTSLSEEARCDKARVRETVSTQQPDLVVIAGWLNPAYVALTSANELETVTFIMGMDTPWRDTPRQRLACLALRRYLRRLSGVFVPGERAWQFARRLGFPESRIHRGMYGVDCNGLDAVHVMRQKSPWPRAFLYAGRYAEEKGVDVLVDAYRRYRSFAESPWDLHVCGMGPLASRFAGQKGVIDHGFLQPEATRELMARSGVMVLPSRYDPWPLIVTEAAASGLPLVVSESCGSAVELLRPRHNGLLVPPKTTPDELVSALYEISVRDDLSLWGERSRELATAYSAGVWADRWLAVASKLLDPPLALASHNKRGY